MTWTGAIVLYASCWFVTVFLILPRGETTQDEAGEIEPGTPPGAPADLRIGRKLLWATGLATLPVIATTVVMATGVLTLDDFDFLFPASFFERPLSER